MSGPNMFEGMPNPWSADNRATPAQINQLEQIWQMADKELTSLMSAITMQIGTIAQIADLQAYSPSFRVRLDQGLHAEGLPAIPTGESVTTPIHVVLHRDSQACVCATHQGNRRHPGAIRERYEQR